MLVVRKEGKAHQQYNAFRSAFELLEAVGREPTDSFAEELQEGIPTVQKLQHQVVSMQQQMACMQQQMVKMQQQNEQQMLKMQQQNEQQMLKIQHNEQQIDELKTDNEMLRAMITSEHWKYVGKIPLSPCEYESQSKLV